MSHAVRWVSSAVAQLKAITDFIEPYSDKAANALLDEIIDFADSLAGMPMRFPECQELPNGTTFSPLLTVFIITRYDSCIADCVRTRTAVFRRRTS